MRCGEKFLNSKQHRCQWSPTKTPLKCIKDQCKYSAATCEDHQGGNASTELKDWLENKHIETTVTSIFSFQTRVKKNCTTLNTNVSPKVRSKLQSGQLASDFTDIF